MAVTAPKEYGLLGFRAIIGIPCPKCEGIMWAVTEVVLRGHARFYREAWNTALQTQDLVPFDSESRRPQEKKDDEGDRG
jgi:hypothetical protein